MTLLILSKNNSIMHLLFVDLFCQNMDLHWINANLIYLLNLPCICFYFVCYLNCFFLLQFSTHCLTWLIMYSVHRSDMFFTHIILDNTFLKIVKNKVYIDITFIVRVLNDFFSRDNVELLDTNFLWNQKLHFCSYLASSEGKVSLARWSSL